MYCNELIQQKLKNIKKEQEIFKNNKNFTNESYQISIKLYESFTKTYQQPLFKNVGNFCELTEYHQLLLTLRFLKKFQSYMFILQDIIFSNLSTKAYFKKVKKRMSRSSFYNFKKLLYSLKNKQEIDWSVYLGQLPIKHKQQLKYMIFDRMQIIKHYKRHLKTNDNMFEITNYWCNLRNDDKLCFNTISITTLKKILFPTKLIRVKKAFEKKHPPRNKIIEIGHTQFDLKVIGYKQNSLNRHVYTANIIDTSSRFVYSQVLEKATIDEVIKFLEKAIKVFENVGIKIKSMQTDNAMMFKNTNFINDSLFCKFLERNKIIKRLIPFGQPQANGTIERYHRTIDDVCLKKFAYCHTLSEMNKVLKAFTARYNYCRYHYYYELKSLNYKDRYIIPINAIKQLIIYNEESVSKKMVH